MRALAAVVIGLGLCASGCGGSSSESASAGSSSGAPESTSTGAATSTDDPDTGVALPGCGDNLLEDPGFEGGSANSGWEDASVLFPTPICDASCTDDVGANPFSGSWWVWFGGVAQPDTSSVRQTVVIPEGNAVLRFGFSVNAGSGTGNDVFLVLLDDDTLLRVDDRQVGSYGGWRVEEVDIPSSYADGGEHELSFEATLAGVGLTSFFLDDVELLLCDPDVSGSSSSSSSTTSNGSSGR